MDISLVSSLILCLQVLPAIAVLADPKGCFNVLDKSPSNEVKNIYFMKFNEIAHTQPATDMLICFLNASHPHDKSITEQYFDVYKKCDHFEETNFEPFGDPQLQALVSLGLPYDLEKDLRIVMKTGSKKKLKEGIIHVQDVMTNKIELSDEFKCYKEFIFKKIKSNQQIDSENNQENMLKLLSKQSYFLI